MNVQDYIKVYEETVDDELCNSLMSAKLDYKPSSFSNHEGITKNSEERVVMDDVWIRKDNKFYDPLKGCFVKAVRQYEFDFPRFSCEHTTDFRINKYGTGGFMSEHIDNIHHSHGQKYGYPQATVLLFLNDDFKGGQFIVSELQLNIKKGDAIIFPSNFMFPHEVKKVTSGTRWSIVSWLM